MDEVSDVRRYAGAAISVSSPVRNDEPDPRQSLRHVLAATDPLPPSAPDLPSLPKKGGSSHKSTMIWIQEGGREYTEDEGSVQNDSYSRASDINPSHTMTVTHTRRNANGTIGSVYSGNKIRHLKKDDGIPLWRRDIQYAFLRTVFEDTTPVFTKISDCTTGNTFADIYIDAMARSSKTSKILKDKLLTDHAAALNMAMVCLLVNVGRMNTTLNCETSGHRIARRKRANRFSSLPRNACTAPDVSFDSVFTSPSGS
jgi:Ino eighty subunit 1